MIPGARFRASLHLTGREHALLPGWEVACSSSLGPYRPNETASPCMPWKVVQVALQPSKFIRTGAIIRMDTQLPFRANR